MTIKIDEQKILEQNDYSLEIGCHHYQVQMLQKNGINVKLVWTLRSLTELNKFASDPTSQFKALYIFVPYPNVYIGVNNLDGKGTMQEFTDLKRLLAWLNGDIIEGLES